MAKKFDGSIIREVATVTMGTLADQAAVTFSQLTISEDFRILKSEIVAGIIGMSDDEQTTGLVFGICNGELSDAEIAECLTAGGPLDRNDALRKERSNRWVKMLSAGQSDPLGPGSGTGLKEVIFKNETGGSIIESKNRWTYSDPEGWLFFIFNNSGSALGTGATGRLLATHYGVWVT